MVQEHTGMRYLTIMTIAALAATSACGSSGGGSASSTTTPSGGPKASGRPTAAKANVPGFSGAVEQQRAGQGVHIYGECLRSWYARKGAGTHVHVEYAGPANVSVDLTISDESEPPPEAHKAFTLASGQHSKDVTFPAIPHVGYPQITVTSGQTTLNCDAAAH